MATIASDDNRRQHFVLAPSDLTFLLDDCARCFYLKIVSGIRRQKGPMPWWWG